MTTKNSEQAVIKVVEEIRYPQADEANQIEIPALAVNGVVGVGTTYNITVFNRRPIFKLVMSVFPLNVTLDQGPTVTPLI